MALHEIPTTFSILFTSYGELARHRPVEILTIVKKLLHYGASIEVCSKGHTFSILEVVNLLGRKMFLPEIEKHKLVSI